MLLQRLPAANVTTKINKVLLLALAVGFGTSQQFHWWWCRLCDLEE